jgi:hypothetical protein
MVQTKALQVKGNWYIGDKSWHNKKRHVFAPFFFPNDLLERMDSNREQRKTMFLEFKLQLVSTCNNAL